MKKNLIIFFQMIACIGYLVKVNSNNVAWLQCFSSLVELIGGYGCYIFLAELAFSLALLKIGTVCFLLRVTNGMVIGAFGFSF